jgi:hypothetical protein
MPHETTGCESTLIVFRFQGGALNGQTLRSDRPSQGVNNALIYWGLTWKGTIGRRFDVSVPGAGKFERYKVSSKFELRGEIHVACEQVPLRR